MRVRVHTCTHVGSVDFLQFFFFLFLKGRGIERKTKQYQLLHPPNQKSTERVFKSSGLEEEEKGRAESGSGKGEEFC